MKGRLVFTMMACAVAAVASAQALSFEGNMLKVLEETPEKSTGLEKIYVLYSAEGVSVSYSSPAGNSIKWYRYGNLGGGHAEETASSQSGDKSTLAKLEGDCGYIVEDGDRRFCFWITDYSRHRLKLTSAAPATDMECGASIVDVTGEGAPIRYFTITGVQKTLDQEITVEYDTQEWSDNDEIFVTTGKVKKFESLQTEFRLVPPNYCPTVFRVTGDKFLKAWNMEESVVTTTITPFSIDAQTFALQKTDGDDVLPDGSNQIGAGSNEGLGGSAPCPITFQAFVTDGVLHNEWQLTSDPSFENIDFRFTTQDLDYTFLDAGTYYARYIGSNADGSCVHEGETYVINIGDSELLIPNAFSPNGDGVNDEWKVAYRSLLKFDCHIFDRYGHEVCHLTSPEQGWDGKVRGKTVDSGVFYYVIEATGTDGKRYKKSGDINVVKYVGTPGSGSSGATM